MTILAIDPGTTTGLFLFKNWSNYQITSFTSEKWLERAKNLENLLKNETVNILACEVSSMWAKQNYNYHYGEMIKLVGHCEYLAYHYQIEYIPVSNKYRNIWEEQAKEGSIRGLTYQKEKGKGKPKGAWYFKDQKLNEHEKDAVLIFYIYWVKFQKQEWPFA